MNQPLVTLVVERHGDDVHVAIVGELDLSNAADTERQFEDATSGAAKVVVDLTPVTYLDSSGIHVLVHLARRQNKKGAEFLIVAPRESIAGGLLRLVEIPELPIADN